MIESILIGIFSSLSASGLFLIVLFKLRPIIEISPEIADQSNNDGPCYAFKFINRSKYQAFDISIETILITPIQVPGGPVNHVKEVILRKSHFHELGGFSPKDKEAHYAFRVATFDDLRSLWISDTQYLRINVVASHALSGFSSVQTMVFNTKSQIKKGKHRFGNNLNVEPLE
ncbi:hypothetical protein [Nitrosomonas ureae]|uniref:Uncharacterized protein n=1 Tax=Nitrosomonas ureae TaxID=44577 RepID=A0A1H2G484_9PROT|nr:hypothetical protein [Nitrosomonas ureae]ALQ52154.1 hypothetical protein ATY38_13610 [Nitrosomonas ureae]SDU14098.1 hypothetical protein SAMN05216406_12744 [Nitrosomonas ureae]